MAVRSDFGLEREQKRQQLLHSLVFRTLRARPGSELYEEALASATQTLQQHQFLDPIPKVVDSDFDSLEARLIRNAQQSKATVLQTLRSELQALIIPSEIAEQGEAAARLLSVLWNLYQSPLSTPLPTASVAEPAADDQDAGFVSDADSELSYWGDEPDLHAHHSDEEPDAWQLHDATWQPAALAYSEAHMPAEQDHVYDAHAAQSRPWPAGLSHALRAHGELAEAGRPLDWRQADCLMSELLWGKHMLNPKAFPDRNLGTTEAELSRQVLNMLLGSAQPGRAFVLKPDTLDFEVTPRIHVGHFSEQSLHILLRSFAAAGSQAYRVHRFVQQVVQAASLGQQYSPASLQTKHNGLLTMQALANGLRQQLSTITSRVHTLLPVLQQQPALHGTESVLLQLHQRLQGVLQHCDLLSHIVCSVQACTADLDTPAEQAAAVLDCLYGLVQEHSTVGTASGNARATKVLQLLYAAVQPLMQMLSIWLGQGQLVDPNGEFFVEASDSSISPASPSFWTQAYSLRTTQSSGRAADAAKRAHASSSGSRQQVPCAAWLQPHAAALLDAGKAQALLLHMPEEASGVLSAAARQRAEACVQAWSDWAYSSTCDCRLWDACLAQLQAHIQEHGSMATSSRAVETDKHRRGQGTSTAQAQQQAFGAPIDGLMPMQYASDDPFDICRSNSSSLQPSGASPLLPAEQRLQPGPRAAPHAAKPQAAGAQAASPLQLPAELAADPAQLLSAFTGPLVPFADLLSLTTPETDMAKLSLSSEPVDLFGTFPSPLLIPAAKAAEADAEQLSPSSVLKDSLSHQVVSHPSSGTVTPVSCCADGSATPADSEVHASLLGQALIDHSSAAAVTEAESAQIKTHIAAESASDAASDDPAQPSVLSLAETSDDSQMTSVWDSWGLSTEQQQQAQALSQHVGPEAWQNLQATQPSTQADAEPTAVPGLDVVDWSEFLHDLHAEAVGTEAASGLIQTNESAEITWLTQASSLDLSPASLMVQQCLCQPLLQQVHKVEEELLRRLHGAWSLGCSLHTVASLFLLSHAGMQTFADGLLSASQVDKLSAGGLTAKLREQLAAAAGPGFLDDAESVSVGWREVADESSMAVGESSARAQLLQKLPALRIFCQLPWPLAAVISNPAQQMYSRVLALLLQLRLAVQSLAADRHVMRAGACAETSSSLAAALALRMSMHRILSAVQGHMLQQLNGSLLSRCLQAMQEASNLQDVCRAHDSFLRRALFQTFQLDQADGKQLTGHKHLVQLCEAAVRLADILPALLHSRDESCDMQMKVRELRQTWQHHYKGLTRFLEYSKASVQLGSTATGLLTQLQVTGLMP